MSGQDSLYGKEALFCGFIILQTYTWGLCRIGTVPGAPRGPGIFLKAFISVLDQAREEGIDAIFICGDLFHRQPNRYTYSGLPFCKSLRDTDLYDRRKPRSRNGRLAIQDLCLAGKCHFSFRQSMPADLCAFPELMCLTA